MKSSSETRKTMRKFQQNPLIDTNENAANIVRIPQDMETDSMCLKPKVSPNEVILKKKTLPMANVNQSLYMKLINEDLTSTGGPSQKYWRVIAERRRKALEELLEENQRLQIVVGALENENLSCKQLLETTTDLVNTLKEAINDSLTDSDGLRTPERHSSEEHLHKKMKLSNYDSFSSDSD